MILPCSNKNVQGKGSFKNWGSTVEAGSNPTSFDRWTVDYGKLVSIVLNPIQFTKNNHTLWVLGIDDSE